MEGYVLGRGARTPNDPKLSDRGARRGTCMVGGKAAAEAGAVTCGAVRCSAWLGFIAVGSAGGVFRAKVVGFSSSLPSVFHDAFRIGDFSGWLFGLVITGEGG